MRWSLIQLILAEIGPSGGGDGAREARPTSLKGANLRAAGIAGADFQGADLSGATLASADVGSAEFLAPSGQGTGQQRATSFAGANLRGADLSDVDLDLATTIGADTTGAVMPKVESKASEPKPSAEPRRGGRRPGGPPIG